MLDDYVDCKNMRSEKNINLRPCSMGNATEGICRELWVVEESEDESLMEALFA